MRKLKQQKGITLVALIVTIIVLLILAGVTLSMVMGDSGIFSKANEAKEKTQIADIKEQARLDILEEQTKNDGKLTEQNLKDILNKYFKDVPETLPEDLTTLTLETKEEYGNYSIKVSEIYSGTLASGGTPSITWAWTDSDTSGTKNIGDVVNCSTGESFRIISTEGEDYALLAEKNIGVDLENSPDTYLKQNDSAGTVAFCSSDTYSSLGNILRADESLNDNVTIIADKTSAVYYARKYAESITRNAEDGRLMTVDVVVALGGDTSSHSSSVCPSWINTSNYWLGSGSNSAFAWFVDGENSSLHVDWYNNGRYYGVRPVIEISKSLIHE